MRPPADEAQIRALARGLGRAASTRVRLYLTGGATAILEGWRVSTIDVDVRFDLYRYPAIDPAAFRRQVAAALG